MASTYSDLKIELIGTGEQVGSWGTTTNTNLGTAIEEAITGSSDVAFSSADVTLTLTNTNASQVARHLRLRLTGTSGGARNLTVPDIQKNYVIKNELADAVTVKNTTGTTVVVPAGTSSYLFSTGVGVEEVISSSLFVPAGVILMWSGSIASIPFGWALCDGSSGRPDLRNMFVIGAHSDSGGVAETTVTGTSTKTGGDKDAIVPSHTHTASSSSSVSDPGHIHTLRAQASGAELPGYGLTITAGFENRPIVALGSGGGRTSDTATTGISVSTSTTVTSTGVSVTNANLPPYFALAYIIKL